MAYSVSWSEIQPTADPKAGSPCARSSHGLSFIESSSAPRLILHGGEATARTPLAPNQATWAADLHGEKWEWRLVEREGAPPPRVAHSQAVVSGGLVYIFGGRQGIEMGEKALNDLWLLDASGAPGDEAWSEVKLGDGGDAPPEPRSFHKMVAIGTDLYVFGGCGAGGRLADLHKFDTVNKVWRNLGKSNLRGRGGANLIHFEESKRLAVVAGFAGEETNDGHAYNLRDGCWEESAMEGLEGMRPRSVCVSASLPTKGTAFIFGGEVDPSDRGHEGAGGFEEDIVILSKTGAVEETIRPSIKSAEWPEKRGWSDGTLGNTGSGKNSLFVFGGLSGDDKNPRRLGDLWRCDID